MGSECIKNMFPLSFLIHGGFFWLLTEMGCCTERPMGMERPFLGQICWGLCLCFTSVSHLCSLPPTQPDCDTWSHPPLGML